MDIPSPFVDRVVFGGDGHQVVAFRAGPPAGHAPVVVAAHGITSSAMAWLWLAELLPEVTLVALDHRGRGESSGHPGPYGVRAHGRDCVAALDACGVEQGLVLGHSMGAFVAAQAAVEAPSRWVHAVLVDGGLAIPLPADTDPDAAIDEIVGPAVARLAMSWENRDEVLDFWRAHPALAEWDDRLDQYVDHDVRPGPDGRWRSRVDEAAIRFDGRELLVDDLATEAAVRAPVPLTLLRAQRGLLGDQGAPLLSPGVVEQFRGRRPDATIVELPDELNHYTVLLGSLGAGIVADTVRSLVL